MSMVQMELDEELVALLRQTNQPLPQAARECIVLELYRRGVLSSGKAAQIVAMTRWEFVRHASRLGLPFYEMTEDEWEAERAISETL